MNNKTSPIYCIISIDTEEEKEWGKDYHRHDACTVENIKHLHGLHVVFRKYGVKATYLITYPVAVDDEAVAILKSFRDEGLAEIGAHLHPWCTPPYEEEITAANTFTHNLPVDLQSSKFTTLTNLITERFGKKPTSFRAGRYGFDEKFIPLLEKLDYRVDTSVVPFRLAQREFEPNFGYLSSLHPYYLNHGNKMQAGKSSILEVPLTVGFTRPVARLIEKNFVYFPDIGIRKALRLLLQTDLVWLRPSYSTLEQMIGLSNTQIEKKQPILNMMFHSNELMPGGSKYNKTTGDVASYIDKLDKYFDYLTNHFDVKFVGLSEAVELQHISRK